MNYFELFNKVMLELNYRKINVFSNIFKSEHLRILENLNRVNSEVCNAFEWSFLQKEISLSLPAGENSITSTIEGKIEQVFENGKKLRFNPFYEGFFNDVATASTYGYFNDKILFRKSDKVRNFKIYYSTNKIVKSATGELKELMSLEDDIPCLPAPFCEPILVYGTCIRTKANPNFPKFNFWNMMFKQALINLRATCHLTKEDEPSIVFKKPKTRLNSF